MNGKSALPILTPQQAPALAAELRARVSGAPVVVAALPRPDPTDWIPKERPSVSAPPGPLAGEPIWYEDPARKQVHRDLVLPGMSGRDIRASESDGPG